MFSEKEVRLAIREELRNIVVRHNLKQLNEQKDEKEDVDFDPSAGDSKIPKGLQKLLDPDLPPNKFKQLDAKLDDQGSPQHQAIALATYALNYADNDQKSAEKILGLAKTAVPNLIAQQDSADTKE